MLEASPNACAFLGMARESVVGAGLWDLLPPPVREERFNLARQVLKAGHPARIVGMVRGVWLSTTYRPVRDKDGAIAGMMICSSQLGPAPVQGNDVMVIHAHTHDMGRLSVLSRRELEVLCKLGRGKSLTEIARALYRSQRTIESHRRSLGLKLGIKTTPELARLAADAGLLWVDEAGLARLLELMHNDAEPAEAAG